MRPLLLTTAALACLSARGAEPEPSSPAAHLLLAEKDSATLKAKEALYTRYVSAYHRAGVPRKLLREQRQGDFMWNSWGKDANIHHMVAVAPGLWRVNLVQFTFDPKLWEKYADVEPFWHVRTVRVVKGEEAVESATETAEEPTGRRISYDGGLTWRDEKRKVTRTVKTKKETAPRKEFDTKDAPWADREAARRLARRLGTEVPIVRLDWLVYQSGADADRLVKYRDILGFKNEKEFQALGGADVGVTQRLGLDLWAFLGRSTVTLNNREIEYDGSLTGGYVRSRDYLKNVDVKNPIRLLGGDARHDASEQYILKVNKTFATGLFNQQALAQDTAPDTIASDSTSGGTDRRVHDFKSCVGCHLEGMRPVDSWAKSSYGTPFKLESYDPDKERKLRGQYLRNLKAVLDRMSATYAEGLKEINSLTPAEQAKEWLEYWNEYELEDRDLEAFALELGVGAKAFRAVLAKAGKAEKELDPVLAALYNGRSIRFEHLEEIFPEANLLYLAGGKP